MGERLAFRRTLHLNDAAIFGHHHVHIGFRRGIFNVFQIANRFAIHDAYGDRRHHSFHRVGFQLTGRDQLIQRIGQRHAGSGDRRGTGAAVCLQHIAVQSDGELTQRFQVNRSAQRTRDQALDFHGASALLTFCGFARVTRVGRTRQHAVFGGDPPLALAFQKARHAFINRSGAQYFRVTKFDQHGAFCVFCVVTGQGYWAHLISATACWTHDVLRLETNVAAHYTDNARLFLS